ncbi:LLM class flavin-dependent oxidoreductase [Azoarcus taiwanensis]|uniref:LLM class flavin-dependent oxidoreductase n=1 Tax=Azoarcus taiwanensis TaxID=666964 RepID=A0A972FAJ0_9RHOO|nr:LLM class flavin-dependent oxidoreductase [Azoarcus taiwanensis]NMG04940.1 LLM class flavin-dependent oxidoreductase [Azoarcus taiwanensis]
MSLTHSLFLPLDNYVEPARPPRERLREALAEGVLAEALGFHAVYCAEHHLSDYGLVPNPAVFLAHLAAQTTRIRLGPAIANLNARNPLTVAEDYALLDQLSDGRLVFGIGSGYLPDELATFGVDDERRGSRFAERLTTVRKLLAGRLASHAEPDCLLKRDQLPLYTHQPFGPQLAVATFNPDSAHLIGSQGLALWLMPHATCCERRDLIEIIDAHREGFLERLRLQPGVLGEFVRPLVAVCLPAHVSNTLPDALRLCGPYLSAHLARRPYPRRSDAETLTKAGLTLIGGSGQVRRTLEWLASIGVTEVMSMHAFGGMPTAHVQASLRAFAERVAGLQAAEALENA